MKASEMEEINRRSGRPRRPSEVWNLIKENFFDDSLFLSLFLSSSSA